MKEFEAIGLWHLPAEPSREVAGTLRYSDEEGLRLSLTGTFRSAPGWSPSEPRNEYPLVYGVVNDSPYGTVFTLLQCFEMGTTLRMPGLTTQEIYANRAYASQCFVGEDVRFDAIRMSFSHLYDWLNKTGIKTGPPAQQKDRMTVTLEYLTPERVRLTLAGKPTAIGVDWRVQHGVGEFSLREKASVLIESLGQLSLKELGQRYARPLQNFFALAADTPIAVEEEVLFSDGIIESDDGHRLPIHFLAQPVYRPKEGSKRRRGSDMLFTYQDVEASLGGLLDQWLDFSSEFAPFCDEFFGSLYAPGAYVETRFLSTVKAITLFFGKSRSPNEEVRRATDATKNRLCEAFSGKRKEWVAMAFPTEAEVDFAWSLAAAVKEHAEIMEPLVHSDPEGFVDAVVATQRFYVRYDLACEPGALRGIELNALTGKLNVLLKACILERLGIPREKVSTFFARNSEYAYLKGVG